MGAIGTNCTNCDSIVTTLVDNGNGSFTYVNEDAVPVTIDFSETVTNLVNNGDGTITFTNEQGVAALIDICAIVAQCNSGSITIQDENGSQEDVDLGETLSFVGGDGVTVTITSPNTITINVDPSLVTQTVTSGNEIAVHTSSDGTATSVLESITGFTANADGSFTYTAEDGSTFIIPQGTVSSVSNTITGHLIATHTDGAGNNVNIQETVTGIGYNGTTGDFTYTDENGTPNVVNIPTENFLSNVTQDTVNDTVTFTLAGGSTFTIDVVDMVSPPSSVTAVVTGQTIASHDDGSGTVVNIQETITSGVNNADGSVTITHEDGTTTVVPADIVSTLASNADGSFTYTSEDGTTTNIPAGDVSTTSVVANADGTQTVSHVAGGVTTTFTIPAAETVTTLVLNADGSLNYTSEDGTVTVIPAGDVSTLSTVTNADGTQTLTHVSGGVTTTITVPSAETVTTLILNADGSLTYTNEAGTVTNVPAGGVSVVVDTNTNTSVQTIATHNNGTTTVNIEESVTNLSTTTTNGDGSTVQTYTSEDGTTTDICTGLSRLIDEDGREAPAAPCAQQLLGRTLHVQSPSHTTGIIDVSHADSDQTDTGVVTTTHQRLVLSANNTQVTGIRSIGSGNGNIVAASNTFVSGQLNTNVSGTNHLVTGTRNVTSSAHNILGGSDNTSTAARNLISGANNTVGATQSIVSGATNQVTSGSNHLVVGGGNTVATASGSGATIVGGIGNNVMGANSIVGGGSNTVAATATRALVVGFSNNVDGESNIATGNNNNITGVNNGAIGGSNVVEGSWNIANNFGNQLIGVSNRTAIEGFQNIATDVTDSSISGANNTIGSAGAGVTNVFTHSRQQTIAADSVKVFSNVVGAGTTWSQANVFGTMGLDMGLEITTPTERLHVGGNVLATGVFIPSDVTLKDKIAPLESKGDITKVSPKTFVWKSENDPDAGQAHEGRTNIGFSAQEIQAEFPEAVREEYTRTVTPDVPVTEKVEINIGYKTKEITVGKGKEAETVVVPDMKSPITETKEIVTGYKKGKTVKGEKTGRLLIEPSALVAILWKEVSELKAQVAKLSAPAKTVKK